MPSATNTWYTWCTVGICASCSRVLVQVIMRYENHWLPHPTRACVILIKATLPTAPMCCTVVVVRSDNLQLWHKIIPCSLRYSRSQFVSSVTQITLLSSKYKNGQWGKLGSTCRIQYTLYTCNHFWTKEISCLSIYKVESQIIKKMGFKMCFQFSLS